MMRHLFILCFSLLLIVFLLGCAGEKISTKGGGPYKLEVQLPKGTLYSNTELEFSFNVKAAWSNKTIENIRRAHESLFHIFVTSKDFNEFSHLHVDGLSETEGELVYFFKHKFKRAGGHQIAIEFVHNGQVWNRFFEINIADKKKVDRKEEFISPENFSVTLYKQGKVYVGDLSHFELEINKNNRPVRNLELFLGAELHGVIWKSDWTDFGHLHSFTPKMKAIFDEISSRQKQNAPNLKQLQTALVELICEKTELVFEGPKIPFKYVFKKAGTYYAFVQVAPNGVPKTFRLIIEVVDRSLG